jgi:ribose-phosphate pyrophosphokinase
MLKIMAGSASKEYAQKVAKSFGTKLVPVKTHRFSDGEFSVSIEETIRGDEVAIIQSTFPPTDNLMELLLLVDAAKRASAKRIIAVIPYFGYARQDRKDKPRVPIGAKLVANLLTASGVDRVVTMDLHADQIQGFFEVPVDHLYANTLFVPHLQKMNINNLCIATPDTGGTKRANSYSKFLGVDMAICYKQRKVANQVDSMTVIGDVSGKDVVLVDDICDTASVRALCTHAVLSGPAYQRIEESVLTELIVTDTIPIDKTKTNGKIKVIPTNELFATTLHCLVENRSISDTFLVS